MATTTEVRPPGVLVGRLAFTGTARGALIWGAVFALTVISSVIAYKSTYGTPAERAQLLRGITGNSGIRALFGPARRIDTVGGFLAWRTLGLLPLIAGIWGLLVGTRMLRGEEDHGRWETLLGAPLRREQATLATLGGVLAACGALFALTALATVAASLLSDEVPLGGALWLALALCVAADGSASLEWLRWLTPLGWVEEMRPLTGAQPLAFGALVAWTAALTWLSVRIAARRDLGAALLAHHDERAPRHLGLGSATAFSLREALGGLVGWGLGLALTAFVFGFISKAVADIARTSAGVRKHVQSTTGSNIDIASAEGYLALVFVFLAVALSLYAVTHATAARAEEATGRLDTLLSSPLGRRRWLWGRIAVAVGTSGLVALLMALAAWAGAAVKDAGVSLPDLLETSLNTLPVVILFLGVAILGFALVPRHTGAIAFGAVGAAYLWEETGAVVKAPEWVLGVSPFHWLALVPSEPFDVTASAVMIAVGAAAALAGAEAFRRRDVVTA